MQPLLLNAIEFFVRERRTQRDISQQVEESMKLRRETVQRDEVGVPRCVNIEVSTKLFDDCGKLQRTVAFGAFIEQLGSKTRSAGFRDGIEQSTAVRAEVSIEYRQIGLVNEDEP